MQLIDPLKFRTDMFTWIVRGAILVVLTVLAFIFKDELLQGRQLLIMWWKQGVFGWRTFFFLLVFFGIPTVAGILAWRYLGKTEMAEVKPVAKEQVPIMLTEAVKVDDLEMVPLTTGPYPRQLFVNPLSSQISDPSNKQEIVRGAPHYGCTIPDRWDPDGSQGLPQVKEFPEMEGKLFNRLTFNLTVREDYFKFTVKLMTEKGTPINGEDLFNVMDEVALDFRFGGGTFLLYYRDHKEHIVHPISPDNATRCKVSIHVVYNRNRKRFLQVNANGSPLYAVPFDMAFAKKLALITWSDHPTYHMSFTNMTLWVDAGK